MQRLYWVREASSVIKSGEASVGIYPEGTRSKDGTLLSFKSGAFKIAQKAKCPIVIAVIRGSEQILKGSLLRRKEVILEIVHIISAEEAASCKTVQLSEHVHNIMEEALGLSQKP